MKALFVSILAAVVVISCATTQQTIQKDAPAPLVRDFTNMEFVEIAHRPIQDKDYSMHYFTVSSMKEIPDLPRAKATLMFKDLETNEFLEETYEMKAVHNTEGKLTTQLMTVEPDIGILEKRAQNVLFVVKLEFDNMIFFSNVKRPYHE